MNYENIIELKALLLNYFPYSEVTLIDIFFSEKKFYSKFLEYEIS